MPNTPYIEPEKVDTSKFKLLTSEEIIEILGLTIKRDEENKLATLLCLCLTYTNGSQFNISFNAPSSTGKSFIALEISALFPDNDVVKLGKCSPNAFYHEQGEYDKEKNTMTVDLSRKIIIFMDQPNTALLERLRSLLSHDQKEIHSKITDKNQGGGNRTKTVIIIGYPSVIFCSAGLQMDEQENTRFLLLSPQISQEKIREGILATIRKETNNDNFKNWLEADPDRKLLKERIMAIKNEGITEINIKDSSQIEAKFLSGDRKLKPRHQRDVKRLMSLVRGFALINLWWRKRSGTVITANDDDVDAAIRLWDKVSVSQELNLPPYVYYIHEDVIKPAWKAKNEELTKMYSTSEKVGLTRQEICTKYFEVYGHPLEEIKLRQQILPMLEASGQITQEQDINDKRKMLVFPVFQQSIDKKENSVPESGVGVGNNSVSEGGVKFDPEGWFDEPKGR